ncbi:MAG: DUF11 domain-containing protein [Clostridia bacterium]|nr:DUF11 domain-containing protein [Clostridia bacterium]
MPNFYNQAALTFGNVIRTSNIVQGTLIDTLTATKTATRDTYTPGATVTFTIALVNSGTANLTGLTVSDDLGAYTCGTERLVPLTYVDGSVLYYSNGVLQPTPIVGTCTGLSFSDIKVSAGGNAVIVYQAAVNGYAPLGDGASVVNTATVSGGGLVDPVTAEKTLNALGTSDLYITKAMNPTTVTKNGSIEYIFTIYNNGPVPVAGTDGAIVSDTFNPLLSGLTVTFNGVPWTLGVHYTYNAANGEFRTLTDHIAVPAAAYSQNADTGVWNTSPGISTLIVSGTV